MKKKYIALILCAVILLTAVASGVMFIRNGNAFHEGRALISKSGDFIFIDDRGSPIIMGDADEKKFSGITDGDKVLVLYGVVLESYPARSNTHVCFKLADGSVDDIGKDTLNQLKELGWIDSNY